MSSQDKKHDAKRTGRKSIAVETLRVIKASSYTLNGITHDLSASLQAAELNTQFYAVNSILRDWKAAQSPSPSQSKTEFSFHEISTLQGARLLSTVSPTSRIGILNFASAKKPGGGFLTGAQAQEESIARSSTLYPTLISQQARQYYELHKKHPRGGFYSDSMIFSPGIVVFRDDKGELVEPLNVDVVTSPAVNAGVVRKTLLGQFEPAETEEKIAKAMRERMGRILYLFEQQGVKNVVLGSFGTGVFKNKVDLVGRVWAEYLSIPGARFEKSFERVVFAILGEETFRDFQAAYQVVVNKVPTSG
ncbi:hypothetical protein AMATHDRAFT_154466 [Amanita thiersii Skay4041]|uniref:Microbial-type PARG catalytic domain-containing protein n=1 Tax=Amanita thiersii Skay4041 TaxID=703135 RepID=A0A2A9N9C0_9AGAR|nr:hypothetical protein AMATHDRAFT_154466 [Amanita thiersii Skay4041]